MKQFVSEFQIEGVSIKGDWLSENFEIYQEENKIAAISSESIKNHPNYEIENI